MTAKPASTEQAQPKGTLARRIAGQGALLASGIAFGQLLSLVRNALLGYGLSKGDFGIAATITIALQLFETLSDLGADRLLVQAEPAAAPRLMAAAHATLFVRGLLSALALYFGAGLATQFFGVPQARSAFEIAALVPLIKGLMHLEPRRRQRDLDNGASLAVEVVPQAIGLALTMPVLAWNGTYMAVVWLGLAQAALGTLLSHVLARGSYRIAWHGPELKRIIAFGWPIWLSAFPLVAVYQGDRMLIGRVFGMEALAGYSAAFMLTMVPGLLAAKVGNALLLPLLAYKRHDAEAFASRYRMMCEGVALVAAAYLAVLVITGGELLALAFGPAYTGLGAIVAWLAVMWSLRMLQSVPGMALMALGDTRPLLYAGIIRAAALLLAIELARSGAGLVAIAAAGSVGELASLLFVAGWTSRHMPGLTSALLTRSMLLLPAGAVAILLGHSSLVAGLGATLGAAVITVAVLASAAALALPGSRRMLRQKEYRAQPAAPAVSPPRAGPALIPARSSYSAPSDRC